MKSRSTLLMGLSALAFLGAAGCVTPETNPVTFQLSVPRPNTVDFSAALSTQIGIGLNGNFPIRDYGNIYLGGEGPGQNFRFGFQLHTNVFVKESWVNYQESSSLPTGAAFPTWMSGPVVDVVIPPANIDEIDWHFYFGTRGQYYVGAAAIIRKINEKFPALNIGYTFRDNLGRVVMGILFFGPRVEYGRLVTPGGIFVGTNITPFLPPGVQTVSPAMMSSASTSALELVQRANNGQPLKINGKTVYNDIHIYGPQASKLNSEKKIRTMINRFLAESKSKKR